jgi:hypothetical protein
MQKPIDQNDNFSLNDVGLTHPSNNAFIKIDESGNIFIMSEPNLGIIIDPSQGSINLVGDKANITTNQDEGFKWNNLTFNPAATNYAEPTFTYKKEVTNSLYDDFERFLD